MKKKSVGCYEDMEQGDCLVFASSDWRNGSLSWDLQVELELIGRGVEG